MLAYCIIKRFGKIWGVECRIYDNFQINFIEVEQYAYSMLSSKKSYLSKSIFGKLFIYDLIPNHVKKIIMLDADIIVHHDIGLLYDFPLENDFLAARSEPKTFEKYYGAGSERGNVLSLGSAQEYFNSGVLLIDLTAFKKAEIVKKAIAFLKKEDKNLALHDQDGLNYAASGVWKEIPHEWHPRKQNILTTPTGVKFSVSEKVMHEINAAGLTHFTGQKKPWDSKYNNNRGSYLFYLEKTSFNEVTNRLLKYERNNKRYKYCLILKKFVARKLRKLRPMLHGLIK